MSSPRFQPSTLTTSTHRARIAFTAIAVTGVAALVAACAPPSPYGHGDNPSGSLDSVTLGTGNVTVSGWAADVDAAGPVEVMFWVDGKLRPERVTASGDRPDVGVAIGRPTSGYSVTLAVPGADTSTRVCVSALNVGAGASSLLGCRRAVVPAVAPPPTTTAPTTTAPTTTVPPPPTWLGVGETARVSVANDGTQAGDSSGSPAVSGDGRYVAFTYYASDLVAGDTNNRTDVFVRDTVAGTTTRVSVATDGTQSNDHSYSPTISADGRYVSFHSPASNLVPGDTNGTNDVFVRDTVAGPTTRVSVATDGTQADGHSYGSAVSGDGRYVAFVSGASNLVAGDTNGWGDVFVRDTVAGTTTRVSVASDGTQGGYGGGGSTPAVSGDGRYVAFASSSSNLVAGDTNGRDDVFVRDTVAGTTTRVSVATDGTQSDSSGTRSPAISADGRYVAFVSSSPNLVAGDTNGTNDVFVRDTVAGTTTRVSVAGGGTQSDADSDYPAVSGDGRYVVFTAAAPDHQMISSDQGVFVRDTVAGTTTPILVVAAGDYFSGVYPDVSGDGRYVTFTSFASDLVPGDTNNTVDVFAHRFR